ncbi:hypothetical protein EIP75_20950 [Aquabacterium soli]|uniref:Uncharacterized protein n=1 Tax=Aquabacterium soli TaxID=2493092 RepID=A0A426V6R3_9BURK|nr:hypothetical protein EIP75_20950 [Aquabacterium soli]
MDIQALLNAAKQGSSVSDADGSAQNINRQAMRAMLDDYQARLETYVHQQGPNASIGDIVGKKINQATISTILEASLPYVVVQSGTAESAVPSGLQHKFMYNLYANAQDRALEEPLLAYTETVSQLVGKRFTLNYVPASQADADTIASYLPKAHADGSPVLPKEFPTSLPGYLIRLKPQLMLDGRVVASGSQGLPMGTALLAEGGYTSLSYPGSWDITQDGSNTVGNSTAIGISAHGINVAQMNRLKSRMDLIRQQLQAQDLSNVAELSSGLLVTPIWTWFLEVESAARDASRLTGMVHNGGLSYGLFHNVAHPFYSWGVIKSVRFTGANLDIGHVRHLAWSRANIRQEWINHNNGLGQYMSALEHIVPERTFNPRSECKVIGAVNSSPLLPTCAQGVSAVKALGLAAQQGQKVFAITPAVYESNPNIVSTHLSAHSVETRNAIQSYLDAGMAVTIHQAPISQDGWKGAGYIYIDPSSGSGGYIIEGGSNGGAMEYLKDNSTNIGFGLFAAGLFAALLPAWVGLVIGIAAFLVSITVMYMVYMEAILSAQCERAIPCIQVVAMVSTIMAVVGLLALAGSGMGALMASVAGLIFADDMFNGIVGTCNTVACQSTPPESEV